MINRTWLVKMPTSTATAPVDIAVQSAPGSNTTPIVPAAPAADAAYYEWRGRTLRFEQLKLLSTGAANTAWTPEARLGFQVSVASFGNAGIDTDLPDVQLSASFGAFAAAGMAIPALADSVTAGPIIRLIGGAATAGKFYVVNLLIAEDKDENRSPHGTV